MSDFLARHRELSHDLSAGMTTHDAGVMINNIFAGLPVSKYGAFKDMWLCKRAMETLSLDIDVFTERLLLAEADIKRQKSYTMLLLLLGTVVVVDVGTITSIKPTLLKFIHARLVDEQAILR